MSTKPYIVVQTSQSPYHTSSAIDALEAALAATNIGLEVIFIFVGEGVFQLNDNQQNELISHKSIFKKLKALPMYDIEQVYVQQAALKLYGVSLPNKMPILNSVSEEKIANICAQAKQVLVF